MLIEELVGGLAHGLRERIDTLRTLAPYILRRSRDAERRWRDQCDDVFDVAMFHQARNAEFHLDSSPAMKGIRVAHAATVRNGRANAMVDRG